MLATVRSGALVGLEAVESKGFKQAGLLPDQQLPAKVVQQVLRQVDHDWQSYFAARKEWQECPE